MNDNQIIKLFFTRNEDAIAQTAYKYGTRLTGLAANILRNNEDAQECVNDTYLKTWDTIPPTKPEHFFAYLAKICRYFSFGRLDWNNAAKRNGEVVALTQEMEECIPSSWHDAAVESREISSLVSSFLHGQTQENRIIFVRRYWYGDSVSEIALRYELSQSAVMMRLSRTRSKLASYLKKEGSKEDIPSYRSVRGTLKAQNPYRGWIPIAFSDGKIEQMLCEDRKGLRCRRLSAQKCLRHNRFSLRFSCSKGIVLATGKPGFYSSTQELEVDRTSSRVSTF